MKKKLKFSLIEVIIGFSLISIAISFLFISLRNFALLNLKVNRYLPKIVEQEKNYFLLKNLIERIYTDQTHPIDFEKDSFFSFYFSPSIFEQEEKISYFFAKCSLKDQNFYLDIFKPTEDKIECLSSIVLISEVHHFQLLRDQNPEVIFIEYTTKDDRGSWTFFLDPFLMLQPKKLPV